MVQAMFSDGMINFFIISFLLIFMYLLLSSFIKGLRSKIIKLEEEMKKELEYTRYVIIESIKKPKK